MVFKRHSAIINKQYNQKTPSDDALLDFAKIMWENGFIQVEVKFDNNEQVVSYSCMTQKDVWENPSQKEKTEEEIEPETKKPWYKRFFKK